MMNHPGNDAMHTVESPAAAQMMELSTPIGAVTVVTKGDVVIACGFTTDAAQLLGLVHSSLRPEAVQRRHHGPIADTIERYFVGDVAAIDAVPVLQRSTPLRERGWDTLRKVAAGDPISYGELAKRMDIPRGARAAGQVCARNAVSLFVPCHRVVAADGTLNHYAWGLAAKQWLLEFERVDASA
jgi:methylated-DNA-[protein]-cysteine S-methyltransferase